MLGSGGLWLGQWSCVWCLRGLVAYGLGNGAASGVFDVVGIGSGAADSGGNKKK